MPCTGRYAEAWQFAAFFCVEALVTGVDNSGGAANLFLTDTQVTDFRTLGVTANAGMVLYNTTQNTSGSVTAVTATTVTATGVTWNDGDVYRIVAIDARQRGEIEHNLNMAAGDIHVALSSAGACSCTFATWSENYLSRLNIVIAAAFYSCTCGRPATQAMSDDTRARYQEWAQLQLDMIADGRREMCAGETGSDYPYVGYAEQGWTEAAQVQIIANDILRNS